MRSYSTLKTIIVALLFVASHIGLVVLPSLATAGPLVSAQYVFRNPSTGASQENARFGTAIAMSDDTVIIGAPNDDWASPNGGAVFVFGRTSIGWQLKQRLYPESPAIPSTDYTFGTSIALDGDTLVVGSPGYPTDGGNSGAVFVFRRMGTSWTPEARLVVPEVAGIGSKVAVSGSTILVAARREAHIFRREETTWVVESSAGLLPFGSYTRTCIAIEGETIAIGGSASVFQFGSILTYRRGPEGWTYLDGISDPTNTWGGNFGCSVALRDGKVFAGIPAAKFATGQFCVYSETENGWTMTAQVLAGGDCGGAIASTGDFVAATGGGYLGISYAESGGVWTQHERLNSSASTISNSIAVSGTSVLIGSPKQDGAASQSGAAYLFEAPREHYGEWAVF